MHSLTLSIMRHARRAAKNRTLQLSVPTFEMMEQRMLCSATLDQSSGLLTITGTEAKDAIIVAPGGLPGNILIKKAPGVNPNTLFSGVKAVRIDAMGGDDFVAVAPGLLHADGSVLGVEVLGGAGNDKISGGTGNDTLDGGAGHDRITDLVGNNTIRGGEGNNSIRTGAGNDSISTGSGNDRIYDLAGNNIVDAGNGNNRIVTRTGADRITTGTGRDRIYDSGGNNTINAGDGSNIIRTGSGDDVINSGVGRDYINDRGGNNTINGGAGDNRIRTGSGIDSIVTGSGNDSIIDRSGNNSIHAGSGNNNIRTGVGNDTIFTGSGNDYIRDIGGINYMSSGTGRDTVVGDNSGDPVDPNPTPNPTIIIIERITTIFIELLGPVQQYLPADVTTIFITTMNNLTSVLNQYGDLLPEGVQQTLTTYINIIFGDVQNIIDNGPSVGTITDIQNTLIEIQNQLNVLTDPVYVQINAVDSALSNVYNQLPPEVGTTLQTAITVLEGLFINVDGQLPEPAKSNLAPVLNSILTTLNSIAVNGPNVLTLISLANNTTTLANQVASLVDLSQVDLNNAVSQATALLPSDIANQLTEVSSVVTTFLTTFDVTGLTDGSVFTVLALADNVISILGDAVSQGSISPESLADIDALILEI